MDNDFEFDFSRFETPDSPDSASVDMHYSYVRNSRKSYTTSRDSTVPQPERKPYTKEEKVPSKPKTAKIKKAAKAPETAEPSEQKRPSKHRRPAILPIVKKACVPVMLFFGLVYILSLTSKLQQTNRAIYNMNAQISTARSEQVRLSNKLSSLTTVDAIDNYAVNVLGMTKVESYQQKYVSFPNESEVISTSGGKLKGFASDIFTRKAQAEQEDSDDAGVTAIDADNVGDDISVDGSAEAADNAAADGEK